jgi:hypothetical protein
MLGRKRRQALAQLRLAYQRTFATEDGQVVLRHLAETLRLTVTPHVPGDPHETAFRAGETNALLGILDMIGDRSDPARFTKLADESAMQSVGWHEQESAR